MTSEMPPDPFVTDPPVHTCAAPAVPTETIAEIMTERLRRVDQCHACAHGVGGPS